MVERRVSDRKVTDTDSRTGNVSLCRWERHFTLISRKGQVGYQMWGPSLTKDLHTEPKKVLKVLRTEPRAPLEKPRGSASYSFTFLFLF